MEPLTDDEIRELLGATLHGSLPKETMQRVFATLAEVEALRTDRKILQGILREPALRQMQALERIAESLDRLASLKVSESLERLTRLAGQEPEP